MGISSADHAIPSNPQKLSLTSPTSGGSSVGIVLSRIKVFLVQIKYCNLSENLNV
jgi:hypothetical protein